MSSPKRQEGAELFPLGLVPTACFTFTPRGSERHWTLSTGPRNTVSTCQTTAELASCGTEGRKAEQKREGVRSLTGVWMKETGGWGQGLGRQENGGVWMAPGTTWAFPTASTDIRTTR